MSDNRKKKILSLDAGASKIRVVIFNESGITLGSIDRESGANISINPETSIKRIIDTIDDILDGAGLSYDDISHYSLGIAGISNEDSRELLFKKLDEKSISRITHLSSDVNPIFEMNCADNSAILVSVGTGAISVGRDDNNKIVKVGGQGLDKDLGSGYWMGKEVVINLSLSKNIEQDETEFQELLNMSLDHFRIPELNIALDKIIISNDRYSKIASLSTPLMELAKNGNDIALSIIQKSSQHIAEMVLMLVDQISYSRGELFIIANGSVMGNSFYRDSLADAISFDFSSIKWLFPMISTAYYPGLLSSKILGIKVGISDIIRESAVA